MSDRSEILDRLRKSGASAERASALLTPSCSLSAKELYPILKTYILARYMLPDEEGDSDDILELSERSLRRYIRLVREGSLRKGPGNQCGNASSVIVKKVLLMKAIQNDFAVRFTPAQAAGLTTVRAVAEEIARQREAGHAQ